jgi:hypothetical protein
MLPFFPVLVYADHLLPEEGDDTQGYFNDFKFSIEWKENKTIPIGSLMILQVIVIESKDLFLQEICKTKALKLLKLNLLKKNMRVMAICWLTLNGLAEDSLFPTTQRT